MTPAARRAAVATVAVDIAREAGDWPPEARLAVLGETAVAAAVAAADVPVAPGSEVSLVFTDDRHIRALNREYRGKDMPTNVLSFPARPLMPGICGPMLGDVVLARETIEREAAQNGLTPDDHATHLIVHGVLHLLGFDHEAEEDAAAMEGLETAILDRLGIADPYSG